MQGKNVTRAARAACVALWVAAASPAAADADPFDTARLAPPDVAQAWEAGAASPACRRPAAVPQPLGLLQAIDLALCNNPRTRQSWAAARAQAAQVGVARGAYLPNVNVGANAQRIDARNQFISGRRDQFGISASLDYLLFDFGGRESTLAQARESLVAADWTHNATLQTVLLDATQAFYQLDAQQEAVKAAQATERAAEASLEAARARQKAGSATRADVLQAQTAFSQARLSRTQAEGDAYSARGVLANRLGLPADARLTIVPPGDIDARKLADDDLARLMETATGRRPELLAADARVRAAEANVRVQRAAGLPTVSALANASETRLRPGPELGTSAIGVQLNFPLFTGYQVTYRVRAAREQVEQQIATRDQLRNDVSLDVWNAYQNLRTQRQALISAGDLVRSAQESYDMALGRYRAGVGTIVDLINAQGALERARVQEIQARFQWNVAKLALARAIGTIDVALLARASEPPPQADLPRY
jgi:TolC family type I secretion outer membrane protein